MRTLFTADLHLGHENILRFCDRPFETIEEHDRVLVGLWNSVVAPADTVYVIGDFAHKVHPRRMRQLFDSLRGEKHLIIGNHDKGATHSLPWASVSDRVAVSVDGTRLMLDHYPGRSWHGSNRGVIQLYGHVHGRLPDLWNALDVGVDRWNYMPVDLPQILARLAEIPRPADEPIGPTDEEGIASVDRGETVEWGDALNRIDAAIERGTRPHEDEDEDDDEPTGPRI